MATINGATTSTTFTSKTASLEGIANSFFSIPIFNWTQPMPMANPLNDYVTFNYVLSLAALTDEQVTNPDGTYMKGQRIPLICKTAGAEPTNRVDTLGKKFDFYIDNLNFDSLIGFKNNKNTNVTTLSFDVYEPYSMGIFMMALQKAAADAGHKNWLAAPFLLKIDFQGNRQTGLLLDIPGLTRYIPFTLGEINMSTNEKGTTYHVNGSGLVVSALTEEHATTKSDTSVKGRTVQEVLQSGENSLQSVINRRLQQYKEDGIVEVPDEVVILFPIDVSSEGASSNSNLNKESSFTATSNTLTDAISIYRKLGVERSPVTKNLVQTTNECNPIGKSSMGYDLKKKADHPVGKDNVVYDTKKQVWDQSKNTFDITEGNLRFNQDLDIPTIINQTILLSDYANTALSNDTLDENGMRPFWRIDTQVYTITTDANLPKTGTKPRIIVYRIVPYRTHSSKMTAPNVRAPGFDNIKKYVVKKYDYLYTGKNTDVLKFNIDFTAGFASVLPADNFKRSHDMQLLMKWSSAFGALGDFLSGVWDDLFGGWFGGIFGGILGDAAALLEIPPPPGLGGSTPDNGAGAIPSRVSPSGTRTSTDNQGGGGLATSTTQAARYFFDAMSSNLNQAILDMEILGDPFWINQSGLGNYTAKPTQYKDLNSDGTVNYQNGEVDILVDFRTPVDINQPMGLYDFGGSSGGETTTTLSARFSGLYQVTIVKSVFSKGRFTQRLEGIRRPHQENEKEGSLDQLFNLGSFFNIIKSITDLF